MNKGRRSLLIVSLTVALLVTGLSFFVSRSDNEFFQCSPPHAGPLEELSGYDRHEHGFPLPYYIDKVPPNCTSTDATSGPDYTQSQIDFIKFFDASSHFSPAAVIIDILFWLLIFMTIYWSLALIVKLFGSRFIRKKK